MTWKRAPADTRREPRNSPPRHDDRKTAAASASRVGEPRWRAALASRVGELSTQHDGVIERLARAAPRPPIDGARRTHALRAATRRRSANARSSPSSSSLQVDERGNDRRQSKSLRATIGANHRPSITRAAARSRLTLCLALSFPSRSLAARISPRRRRPRALSICCATLAAAALFMPLLRIVGARASERTAAGRSFSLIRGAAPCEAARIAFSFSSASPSTSRIVRKLAAQLDCHATRYATSLVSLDLRRSRLFSRDWRQRCFRRRQQRNDTQLRSRRENLRADINRKSSVSRRDDRRSTRSFQQLDDKMRGNTIFAFL